MRIAVEGSLRRLGTDHIDLYYQHRMDPARRSRRPSARSPSSSQEGKILHYGLSEAAPETIRRAHAVHPVTALQTEYSLWIARPRGGDPADRARTRHRLRAVLAARPRLPDRRDPLARPARRERLPPVQPALRGGEPATQHPHRRAGGGGRRRRSRRRPARSRSPGCSRRATTSRRSPARGASANLEQNVEADEIVLTAAQLARLDAVDAAGRRPLRRHDARSTASPASRGVTTRRRCASGDGVLRPLVGCQGAAKRMRSERASGRSA